MNHSKECVNELGFHTNKIEADWQQRKSSLPTHGRRKGHYDYYLAEFLWKYMNRGEELFWEFLNDMKQSYSKTLNIL